MDSEPRAAPFQRWAPLCCDLVVTRDPTSEGRRGSKMRQEHSALSMQPGTGKSSINFNRHGLENTVLDTLINC